MTYKIAEIGDDVQIGVVLGRLLSPQTLWAKIVAVPNKDEGLFTVREYRKGDDLNIPTGKYEQVTMISLMPWKPPPDFGKPIIPVLEVTKEKT